MADWVTISALASAGGTLVLAGVTVASVRSANRAARVAEQSLLAAQRPLLIPSRTEDPAVKAGFQDDVWFLVPGGRGAASATDAAVYFVIAVRNVGTGLAVLRGVDGDAAQPELPARRDIVKEARRDVDTPCTIGAGLLVERLPEYVRPLKDVARNRSAAGKPE